ncbi:MAG: hypothetical protein IIB06_00735 [Bacteroidetes bacterium]|nr:hypothetical protein [Bacteroidota bacterium]
MKKLVFLFFAISIVFSGVAQKKIIGLTADARVKESFNVVDKETGNFAVFLEENDYVRGFLFDKNYNEIGRIKATDLPSKFKTFIGYQVKGSKINLFMNTQNGRSYGIMIFDFKTGFSHVQELDFKLKGEIFIESISSNNTFYLFSIPKNSSQINIYEFNENLTPILHEIKFKENAFLDRRDRPIKLNKFIFKRDAISGKLSIVTGKIEHNAPNSIEITSKKFKLYHFENKVTFTSDRYNEFTYLITIDLDNYKFSTKRVLKPSFDGSRLGLKSNSFLFDNTLFQIICNTKQLRLRMVDIATEKIVKEYSLMKEETFYFKNTAIILEGGDFDKYRELDKTAQFLRKISQANAGISVYKQNKVYEITFGSSLDKPDNPYIIIGATVGGIGGVLIVASFNTLTSTFNGYTNTKSVRVTGLFDDDFNHIEGRIQKNPFDKIKEYYERNKNIRAQTIFKNNDDFIYGFYKQNQDLYEVIKF